MARTPISIFDNHTVVDGMVSTPTRLYKYNEVNGFIPKTYTCSVKTVTERIIREYFRAKEEEKRIETKVDKETDRAIEAENALNDKVVSNAESILNNAELILKNFRLISANTESIKQEAKERKNADKLLCAKTDILENEVEKIKEEVKTEDEKLKEYIDSLDEKVDSISLINDEEDNLKYYLMVGSETKGEISIPKDGFLRGVEFDDEAKVLTFTVGTDDNTQTFDVNLSSLVDKYEAGFGLKLNENKFEVNLNENSSFLYVNEEEQLDFGMKVIKDPYTEGDIWDYYFVGKDDKFPTYNSARLDLHDVKEYIDSQSSDDKEYTDEKISELKEYTDNEIENLRTEIMNRLENYLAAGPNIKIVKNSEDKFEISVKIDNDIHVANEGLLVDELPKENETLDAAIIKVLNNIVTNADTADGEEISW